MTAPRELWLIHPDPAACETIRASFKAPTMRIPGSIAGTDAVYRAAWAALVAVHQANARGEATIDTVCMPAMGCGFGAMSFDESARQMAAAWRHALKPPTTLGTDWDVPLTREKAIRG